MKVSRFIPKAVSRKVGHDLLVLKKQSPHIFFAAGIVGVVASTVLACKATLKLEETLDDIKNEIDDVKTNGTEAEKSKDLAYVYSKGTTKLVKLYAPSVLVGGASIAMLTGAHVTLTRRNTSLTVAYAGLHKAYDEYRARVREELGEKKELDIYQGATMIDVEDPVTGKKTKHRVVDPNALSPYARIFDEYNINWTKDSELNRLYIQAQQNYANHLLQARGFVFLNEVYDNLGFEHSSAGAVVGWVLDENGDNYVDFGMFEARNSDFINGSERSVWLDFNVDGVIFDKIDKIRGK